MQAETQSPSHNSTWSQIVYVLKLVRSTVIYNYRYDEAYEVASWYGVILLVGSATIISQLLTRILLNLLLVSVDWATSSPNASGALDFLSNQEDFLFFIITLLWLIAITFLFVICSVLIVSYCIDLFFEVDYGREDDINIETEDSKSPQSTWQQFAFAVAIVYAFNLLISPLSTIGQFIYSSTTLGFTLWHPLPLIVGVGLLIISLLLKFYSWIVLYRFIKNRIVDDGTGKWRYALVIIFLEGSGILLNFIFTPLLSPIYNLLIQPIS